MGKRTKTSFKPGQSGNPNGRPRLPVEMKSRRLLDRMELENIIHRLSYMTLSEVEALSVDGSAPMIEITLAKIFLTAHKKADQWKLDFILNRLLGTVRPEDARDVTPPIPIEAIAKKTFTEFCVAAGYPAPYPKQIEMFDFGFTNTVARLLLGARGVGKTDYLTIMGIAYDIYMNPDHTWMVITKEKKRSSAIIQEIANALIANGVKLAKENSSCIRLEGHTGKDHSVDARSIRSGLRGPHPYGIVMDDPVTEEDVSEATRKLVERKYNEAFKLTSNIFIIGQPAHLHDLYAKLRPLLKKMEVPHGTIPELDHDLEAQRLAGIDEKSIAASYFLKILSDGSAPFEKINYLPAYPVGDSVAFLDPSHKGKDASALTIMRAYFEGVAVVGFAAHKAWNHWLDEIIPLLAKYGVKKIAIECNGLGDQPVLLMRQALKAAGLSIGVVAVDSTDNKHARIMGAGSFAHLIHLSQESNKLYTDQVVQYEYGAKHDDAPDSLATCMKWLGLVRGKS